MSIRPLTTSVVPRRRLMQAALELFGKHGFDQTTAAQIAARAGLTERTFFRHFPDKREVPFEGQAILAAALTKSIAEAPSALSPIGTLRLAVASVTEMLEQNRRISEPRQHIIAATPSLQEREIAKHAAIIHVVAAALEKRGVSKSRAELAAQMGLAVSSYALSAWFAAPSYPPASGQSSSLGLSIARTIEKLIGSGLATMIAAIA